MLSAPPALKSFFSDKFLNWDFVLVVVDQTEELVLIRQVAVGVVGLVAVAAGLLLLRKAGALTRLAGPTVGHAGTRRRRGGQVRGRVQEGQEVVGINVAELETERNIFKFLNFYVA